MSILLARLRGLEGLDQHRGDLEQVAADAVVGDLEDRRGVVLVDRDDALGLAHTGLVLDGAGDTESDVDLRVDGLAGLTDLMVGSEPAGVDGNTGAANNAAEHIGELVSELDAALDVLGDTTADGDDVVSADQVDELLGSLDDLDDLGLEIGGVELDTTKDKLENYTKAAQKINPAIQVASAYAGSFSDAGKGKEIANSMVTTNDVDVMFGDASIVDTGAREALSAYSDRYDIGQPADLGSADDKLIANSVVTDNMTMLKESMQDVESGNFGNKVIYGDLSNGGVSTGTFSSIVTDDQQKQYLEYVEQIKAGTFL